MLDALCSEENNTRSGKMDREGKMAYEMVDEMVDVSSRTRR